MGTKRKSMGDSSLTLFQELEAMRVALGYLIQLHGNADADWKKASIRVPEIMYQKPPTVEMQRDEERLEWVFTTTLPKN